MFEVATDAGAGPAAEPAVEPDLVGYPGYADQIPVGERLARWRELAPAWRPTGELARLDPMSLTAEQRIDLLTLLDEQKNWLDSVQSRLLATIDTSDDSKQGLAQEAVSLALRVPLRSAQSSLKRASWLAHALPSTTRLLTRGEISSRQADLITEASWALPPDRLESFENLVTARAPEQTAAQLRQTVRRAGLALDPATAEQRHQRALADRTVGFQPADDGMVSLPVLLGAAEGQLIYTRLTAAATLLPAADHRTMDQKRADLLVDAVLSGLPLDALPERQGRRPSIQVVVSADTLLGLDDQPAHLTGYGPLTADTARRLAAEESATWQRLLTDPDTGQLLDISQRRYRPGRRLRDFVAARDSVCAFPTCNQPGYRCDYEHIKAFSSGGTTCRCNGALACRRHNNCKIDSGWRYQLNPDGTFTWTTATGHSYRGHQPQRWRLPADPVPADPVPADPVPADPVPADSVPAEPAPQSGRGLTRWLAVPPDRAVTSHQSANGNRMDDCDGGFPSCDDGAAGCDDGIAGSDEKGNGNPDSMSRPRPSGEPDYPLEPPF